MDIAGCIRKDFYSAGNVQIFETGLGIGYWADDKMKEVISEFEQRHNALVYMGIKSYMRCDDEAWEVVSLFYVSDHKEEWAGDVADIRNSTPFVYVYNRSIPEFSDLGCIGVRKTMAGGLVRVS